MTMEWDSDGQGVQGLPVHDASPGRTETVRAACLSELARRRRQADTRRGASPRWRGRLELAAAASVAAVYLAGVVERLLEILG